MPYVTCTGCKLTAFSAAYRWQPDSCARCGAELPRPRTTEARAHAPAWPITGRFAEPATGTALQHTRQPPD